MSDWSARPAPQRRLRPQRGGGDDYYGRGRSGGTAPLRRPPGPPGSGGGSRRGGYRPRKRKHWGRRVVITLVVLVALVVGLVFYLDASLQREPALAGAQSPQTAGTNWLLVGSDSRQGISASEGAQLGTGDSAEVAGGRTDTMMLLHIPSNGGEPALISLPRDSYVPIPGHSPAKLNAAFAYGGAPLLAQTVENITGVHIDHYAEIGLPGFATLVNDVDGVQMCISQPMVDPKANLNLKPGCQTLNGDQALGYVRTRAFPMGDLQRVQDQRQFLTALVHKATSPSTLLDPFRLVPLLMDAPKTFTVNSGDHIWNLFFLARALQKIEKGQGVTASVPFGSFATIDGESMVLWNKANATRMFNAIANDQPIPSDLVQK